MVLRPETVSQPDNSKLAKKLLTQEYGLELTKNRKAGPSFSLPPEKSCDCRTSVCWDICYRKNWTYTRTGSVAKRARNFRTVELLLKLGGPELLAQALISLVDQARPTNHMIATILHLPPLTPWTFRIHDLGDFYSRDYLQAWVLSVKARPDCSFWFYTRAFGNAERYPLLAELAALKNCQGWISIDADNWMRGVTVYRQAPQGIWKLALLQTEELPQGLLEALRKLSKQKDIVNFPRHHNAYHIEPLHNEPVMNCPQILGAFSLEANENAPKPCQSCKICLPK